MLKPHEFVTAYTSDQKAKIAFLWQEDPCDGEMYDLNYQFRTEVSDALILDGAIAPDELIKDVFWAEAQLCKAIGSAGQRLTDLGTLLLTQAKSKYIDVFFTAKEQSFDTECCVVCYDVPSNILQQIISELKTQQINSNAAANTAFYIEYLEESLARVLAREATDA